MRSNRYFYKVFATSAAALLAVSLISTAALADEAEPTQTTDPAAVVTTVAVPQAQSDEVHFYISFSGVQDTKDGAKGRAVSGFSGILAKTTVTGLQSRHGEYLVGENNAEGLNTIDTELRALSCADFPSDEAIISALGADTKKETKTFLATHSDLSDYAVKWYVAKYNSGKNDTCWHIDGALVQKTHAVTYAYAASGTDRALPADLNAQLPTDTAAYHTGDAVALTEAANAQVGTTYQEKDANGEVVGTWTLKDWTPSSEKMTQDGLTYTGNWTFAANTQNKVTVHYYLDGTTLKVADPVTIQHYTGSSYTLGTELTSGKTIAGYTYKSTKGAVEGTLTGDVDVNVYFTEDYVAPPASIPSTTPSTPASTTTPTTPTTPVTVPDTTTPTTNLPGTTTTTPAATTTDIPDATTPLATKPDSNTTIPDEAAAKAEAPKTGDLSAVYAAAAAASLGGVLILTKKRKENA